MDHEDDVDTIYNWCTGNNPQNNGKKDWKSCK